MKKYLFTLLAVVLCGCFSTYGADKSAAERNFCNQIVNYLKGEGYRPTIDDDGDVSLKYEGKQFYISVEDYNDGFYVDCFGILGTEDANRRAVLEACCQTAAKWKFLRCYVAKSGSIFYGCNGYFTNFYQLKGILLKYLDIMNDANKSLIDIYNDYE